MAFTKTPAGASNNFTLTGTQFEDITSIINADGVTVVAEGGNDDVSIQNSTNSVTGYNMDMGDGNDRIQFIDDNAQFAQGKAAFQNGTISTGSGDDIVFAQDAGALSDENTASLLYSNVYTGAGNDLVRVFGAISSGIYTGSDIDTVLMRDYEQNVNSRIERFSGSEITLGSGDDLLRVDTADTGVVDTTINGGAGDDTFLSGADLAPIEAGVHEIVSGNWARTTVGGGSGDDTFRFADAIADLYLVGGSGSDDIESGFGNDTVEGRDGADLITISGGANSVLGQAGIDTITIFGNGNNTVYGGYQGDVITIGSAADSAEGNNVVYGDDNTSNAGADVISIFGGGQNTVYGGDIGDEINTFADGFSYVFAGNGADVVTASANTFSNENGGGRFYLGAGHDEFTNSGNVQDAVSIYGGAGLDAIDADQATFNIQAGTQADVVTVVGAQGGTIIQLDGESAAATDVDSVDNFWSDGDVITYANGVDYVTGFVAGLNFLDTTLGDQGLDNIGQMFNANDGITQTQVYDGIVTGRTFYLAGTWTSDPALGSTPNDSEGTFTVDSTGNDYLIITQGNNGPLTSNSNALVLNDIGNGNIALIDSTYII